MTEQAGSLDYEQAFNDIVENDPALAELETELATNGLAAQVEAQRAGEQIPFGTQQLVRVNTESFETSKDQPKLPSPKGCMVPAPGGGQVYKIDGQD